MMNRRGSPIELIKQGVARISALLSPTFSAPRPEVETKQITRLPVVEKNEYLNDNGMLAAPAIPVTYSPKSPAAAIMLETSDGAAVLLAQFAGKSTMVLLLSDSMTLLPGIDHRIARRAHTLGPGSRLVCVAEQPAHVIPGVLIDRDRHIRTLANRDAGPLLVSLDQHGRVFDVIDDSAAILEWLWNEPRPQSIRADGAIGLGDVRS
jgi:hypothetical protein